MISEYYFAIPLVSDANFVQLRCKCNMYTLHLYFNLIAASAAYVCNLLINHYFLL
jgi:hypothetical protein